MSPSEIPIAVLSDYVVILGLRRKREARSPERWEDFVTLPDVVEGIRRLL